MQTDQIESGLPVELECGSNEERHQANGKQFEAVVARQGLVCADPLFFFQDQNKTNKKTPLRP